MRDMELWAKLRRIPRLRILCIIIHLVLMLCLVLTFAVGWPLPIYLFSQARPISDATRILRNMQIGLQIATLVRDFHIPV